MKLACAGATVHLCAWKDHEMAEGFVQLVSQRMQLMRRLVRWRSVVVTA
jgi:hypothetical protein